MDKTKLLILIAALYLLEIKERGPRIREAAKENGVDEDGLFKALKEAGYNPKAAKGSAAPDGKDVQEVETATVPEAARTEADGATAPPVPENEKKPDGGFISVILRHKTDYPRYRRAGLVLKQTPGTFRVSAEQLRALEKDPWVVVKKEGGDE
jgi:hypothetical protein